MPFTRCLLHTEGQYNISVLLGLALALIFEQRCLKLWEKSLGVAIRSEVFIQLLDFLLLLDFHSWESLELDGEVSSRQPSCAIPDYAN